MRTHGQPPYRVVVVHGGPGAAGDLFPVARRLATRRGVLEPMQTAASVQGQVLELSTQIEHHADVPVILIGHSWGAWLAAVVTAEHPDLVRKLILIGSGAFEKKYVPTLRERRMERLTNAERVEFESLAQPLNERHAPEGALTRLGELAYKTDLADPVEVETARMPHRSMARPSTHLCGLKQQRCGTMANCCTHCAALLARWSRSTVSMTPRRSKEFASPSSAAGLSSAC